METKIHPKSKKYQKKGMPKIIPEKDAEKEPEMIARVTEMTD